MNEREELAILRRIAELEAKAAGTTTPTASPQPNNNNIAAQLGLTARSGMQALGGMAGLVVDPVSGLMNAVTPDNWPKAKTLRSFAGGIADSIGLPSPNTPMERIVSQGTEMMTGAGGAARAMSSLAGRATGATSAIARRLAEAPATQVAAAGAGGAAGQQAQETGAGPVGQFVSALGGTLLAGGAMAGGQRAMESVRRALPVPTQVMTRIDNTINISLQNRGIDPATITPAMRDMLRENVRRAMDLGQIDEAAVGRLADYTRLGMTPTRGRLTLDPYDVTQEQNAAKFAAATGNREAMLPTIANDNNRRLLGLVDDFDPVADSFTTGQRAMAPIASRNAALEGQKTALYGRANEMAGGDIPLARGAVLNQINAELERSMKGPFLPAEIRSILNRFSTDPDVPFTVAGIDNLKTIIATAQRGAQDGNVKAALSVVRNALDSMPMEPIKRQFGGNQVVTQQGAQFLRNQDAMAGELKRVLDEARSANFRWREWQRSAPGIEAVVDDANPATFVQNFVRSRTADPRDVKKMAAVINADPGARQAVRSELVQFLKDRAIGRGNDSATGNFSGRNWTSGLSDIGRQKLSLFFDEGEIETLMALGRVGTTETFQPRGSAVNNSNTAAGMAGLLQGLSRMLKPALATLDKVPLGQLAGDNLVRRPLDASTLALLQRRAGNVPGALVTQPQNQMSPIDPLLLPALLGTTSLTQPRP